MVNAKKYRLQSSWDGSLKIGVDYDIQDGADLIEHAASIDGAMRVIMEENEHRGRVRINFLICAIGGSRR
jgi:hypothetical protein